MATMLFYLMGTIQFGGIARNKENGMAIAQSIVLLQANK